MRKYFPIQYMRRPFSYITLQLLHSEFPYTLGKFDFLFYQCNIYIIHAGENGTFSNKIKEHFMSNREEEVALLYCILLLGGSQKNKLLWCSILCKSLEITVMCIQYTVKV